MAGTGTVNNTVRNGHRAGVSLRRRVLSPQTAISLMAAAALATFLILRVDIAWSETWATVRGANPWWYAVAVVSHYTTFIFRGARWRILLGNAARNDGSGEPQPSTFYCGRVILMSWFANSVAWFRIGDAYRAYAYSEDTKTSFPRAVGTVMTDRVVDLTIVLTLMATALGMLYMRGQVRPPLQLAALAGVLLAVILMALFAMLLMRRWIAPKLPDRFAIVYERFHAGTMGSFGRMHLVFGLGTLAWLCEVGRLYFVLRALGVPVAAGLTLFVPMANGLLSAVPLTPGGLGIVETGVSGLLQLELAVGVAVAVALADRVISFLSIIVTGGIVFGLRQARAGRIRGAAPVGRMGEGTQQK